MQYAKRQVTWIRNRLFASSTNNSHFFVLELSGKGPLMQRFENQVRKVAVDIIHTIKDKGFGSIEGGLAEGERK
jgi:tRNA A37 N6-isopentenylltransferase MiaA